MKWLIPEFREHLREKINILIDFFKINLAGWILIVLIGFLFTRRSGERDYFLVLFTIFVSTFTTWFGHYILHHHNKYNPIAKLHKITHHSPFSETFLGKFIEYAFVEFFFFGAGLLLIITIMTYRSYKEWIFDPYFLFYWALAVPVIHEVHYHIFNVSDYHDYHHNDGSINFSPEYWDIIFNTRVVNAPIDNETKMAPTLIGLAICILPFINTKYDFIKALSKA